MIINLTFILSLCLPISRYVVVLSMRTLFLVVFVRAESDVKVVEIGDETVIDGIKSKWVKILLPIKTIKNNKNIYGWVFGGYLTDKLEPVKLCSQLSRKRICFSV